MWPGGLNIAAVEEDLRYQIEMLKRKIKENEEEAANATQETWWRLNRIREELLARLKDRQARLRDPIAEARERRYGGLPGFFDL